MNRLMERADFLLSRWSGALLSILRIITAFLFIQHGTQKVFGFPVAAFGEFDPLSLLGFGGLLEVFGGTLILVGLFTRPLSFLVSGMMAVAYFMFFS